MTDIEVFKKFMDWMQMDVSKEKQLEDGNTVLIYKDSHRQIELFSKLGYDEFWSGVIFDKEGNIVKAYLDSHVAYASSNGKIIDKLAE